MNEDIFSEAQRDRASDLRMRSYKLPDHITRDEARARRQGGLYVLAALLFIAGVVSLTILAVQK